MRKKLLITFVILSIGFVAALLWPTASYDITRVHASLRTLAPPYQSVGCSYFLDGGGIGITIIDRDGQNLQLALPSAANGERYDRLFVGATHTSKAGATEVAFNEDSRRMLIATLERFRIPGDADVALVSLRGAPRDYAHVWCRWARALFQGLIR